MMDSVMHRLTSIWNIHIVRTDAYADSAKNRDYNDRMKSAKAILVREMEVR
jgi:hypothetical protein